MSLISHSHMAPKNKSACTSASSMRPIVCTLTPKQVHVTICSNQVQVECRVRICEHECIDLLMNVNMTIEKEMISGGKFQINALQCIPYISDLFFLLSLSPSSWTTTVGPQPSLTLASLCRTAGCPATSPTGSICRDYEATALERYSYTLVTFQPT